MSCSDFIALTGYCTRFIVYSPTNHGHSSDIPHSWWRHRMETLSALLALRAGNSAVTAEFPSQRPLVRSVDVFFDLRLNKRLSKQSRCRWFETPSRSLWRHYDGRHITLMMIMSLGRQCAVVVRMIGVTPRSSNIRQLLKGICKQICRIYNMPEEDVPSVRFS